MTAPARSPRTYRQTMRAQSTARTHASVLTAAADLVLVAGEGVSLAQVASAAGTTVPTVLRHFASRDRLVDAALDAALARVCAGRERVGPGDVRGAARVLADEHEAHATLLHARAASLARGAGQARRSARGQAQAAGVPPRTRPRADDPDRLHRDWVARTFSAALSPLPPQVHRVRLAQLAVATSATTWWALRETEHLGRAQAQAALAGLLAGLMLRER